MPTQVGFLGLGMMGHGLCKAIAAGGGRTVMAYDADPAMCNALAKVPNLHLVKTAGEMSKCDYIFSCLPNDDTVRSVYMGEDGLFSKLSESAITCDLSTISPALSAELEQSAAEHGLSHITAAMLGSKAQADKGEVFFIVGGKEQATIEKITPLLEVMSRAQHVVGDCATASKVKLIHNALGVFNHGAVAEILVFCKACGVDWKIFYDVVCNGGGMAYGNYFERKVPSIMEGDYSPKFKLALAHKDNLLFRDLLDGQAVPTPLHQIANKYLDEAFATEDVEQDVSIMTRAVEKHSGTSLK